MHFNSMVNRIPFAAVALAMTVMAACSGPVRVPIQPQPQVPAYPMLVNALGQFVLDQSRPGIGAQFAPLPGKKPSADQNSAEALLKRLLSPQKR